MLSNKTYTTAATETVKASKAKALSKCRPWPKTTRKSETPASGSPLHPDSGGAGAGGGCSAVQSHTDRKHGVIYVSFTWQTRNDKDNRMN